MEEKRFTQTISSKKCSDDEAFSYLHFYRLSSGEAFPQLPSSCAGSPSTGCTQAPTASGIRQYLKLSGLKIRGPTPEQSLRRLLADLDRDGLSCRLPACTSSKEGLATNRHPWTAPSHTPRCLGRIVQASARPNLLVGTDPATRCVALKKEGLDVTCPLDVKYCHPRS